MVNSTNHAASHYAVFCSQIQQCRFITQRATVHSNQSSSIPNLTLRRKTSSKRFLLAFRCHVKEGRTFLSCTAANTTDPTGWRYEFSLLWTPQTWTYYSRSAWLFERWRYAPLKRRCLPVGAQNTWKYPQKWIAYATQFYKFQLNSDPFRVYYIYTAVKKKSAFTIMYFTIQITMLVHLLNFIIQTSNIILAPFLFFFPFIWYIYLVSPPSI